MQRGFLEKSNFTKGFGGLCQSFTLVFSAAAKTFVGWVSFEIPADFSVSVQEA